MVLARNNQTGNHHRASAFPLKSSPSVGARGGPAPGFSLVICPLHPPTPTLGSDGGCLCCIP